MRLITLLLFVFSFFFLNAQDCPPGDVTITCQTEMDAFEAQYPNCTQINGNLTIMDDEYTCFGLSTNLPALERITGDLRVWASNNADGFPNLQYVGGGIGVNDEFGGTFAALDTVMGSISLSSSYQGVSFPSCPQLKYVGGNLGINTSEGGELDSHDFPALEYVGGNLYDYSNWTDSDLSGFTSLRYIGGNLDIEDGEIDYFNALDTIGGDLILRNYEFDFSVVNIDITGMNQLKYIGGNFRLNGDPGNRQCVRGLSGLSQLNYIGGDFEYYWQYDGSDGCSNALTNIDGLQQLKHVGGKLRIGEADLLNLDFLTQLESIGGNLEITGNDLENIDGLNHPVMIGGELMIDRNYALSECEAQAVCDHLSVGGAATIFNNLTGCNSIQEVEDACGTMLVCPPDDVIITSQQEMNDFVANFPNCTTINGDLRIKSDVAGADALTDISGLSMLTHISGDLRITEAFHLPSLDGLEQLESIGGDLIFDFIWDRATPLNISALDHAITIDGIVYLGDIVAPFTQIEPCGVQAICDHYFLSPNNIVNVYGACGSFFQACQDPSADCPQGDVFINSQAEADAFAMLFPNCTQINGNFVINSADPYNGTTVNIPELPELQRITGSIGISTHTVLSANSFAALTHVDGGVYLSADIDGSFPALESIGGSISVSDGINTGAGPTGGYPALKYIGGGISAGGPEGGFLNSNDFPLLERIEGGISGCGWGPTHNFSGFDNLRYIGGTITTQQGTISGMNMVDTIGGSINFYDCYFNGVSVNITGLNQLKYIGGNLRFNSDHCLQDLSGLTQLNAIGGDLGITFQTGFACSTSTDSLTGLGQLRHVGDDLSIFESNLTNIDFLGQLESVGDSLFIRSNSFDNLDALNHPIGIGGELIISQNWNLSECAVQAVCDHLNSNAPATIGGNLSGCDSPLEVQAACDPMLLCPSGDISLSTQEEIEDFFTAFANCTELSGNLSIQAATPDAITNFDGFSQITTIGGWLLIEGTSVSDLNGFSSLTSVGNALALKSNLMLTDISGLANITMLPSHLSIENNDALTDLSGLNNITQIGESLLIFDNDNLQNLSGLNALTSIGLQLYLKSNINMTSLSGLESLTSIGTDIRMQGNLSLSSLNALSNVASISGYIQLTNNDALTSLMGLENINPDGITQLTITNNPSLSMCSASSICGHIEDNDTTIFSNNALGCNDVMEVETSCGALPIEMTDPLRVHLRDKTAILKWRTATEINNSGFEIQRSKDGIQWEKIGWQAGQGSTSTPHTYTYTDQNPLFGTSYYRLKQVDTNGDLEYSNIVSLQYIRNGVTVYPNPVKERLYFHTNHSFVQKITIYNTVGSQVAEIINPGIDIDVSTLPKGIYILKITIDDEDFYEKTIVE